MTSCRLNFLLFALLMHVGSALAADAPYLRPLVPGWEVRSILTVGEAAANGYRMAGIPDGLGAMKNADGTISVFMNHEIPGDMGVQRRHGATGAFVSHWVLDIESLKVMRGEDWIRQVGLWSAGRHIMQPGATLNRLCSADLPPLSAVFHAASGKGFDGRLFLSGEETKTGGRAFAHVLTGEEAGISYELPYLGKIAWENVVAHPATGEMTLVMGMDDTPGGQVYVYIGRKLAHGNPVQRAGLMNGDLFAVKVTGERFVLMPLGDVSGMDGMILEEASRKAGATMFLRPEDGAWDTRDSRVFYFSTTDKVDGNSQLFRMAFDDLSQPARGGEISAVLNARDIGAQMFDNLTVNADGEVLLQEDPGNHPHLAAIWKFNPKSGNAEKIAEAASNRFGDTAHAGFMTIDEENSGIIEITALVAGAPWADSSRRYYLSVMQVHMPASDQALVEPGQWYMLEGPSKP